MAAIDSAYHYYISTYGNSTVARYDTHKKSELRAVYNQIVKTNKESPLFKVTDTGDARKTAIDIKERARSIQSVIASFSDSGNGIESVFQKKIAQSSDEDIVSAEYIGDNASADDSLNFNIEVRQLATPQINLGQYLNGSRSDIKPGTYSFDLTTNLSSYEFQYTVGANDTNRDVQDKIVRLIRSAGVGLNAQVVEDASGKSAIQISSKQTGLGQNESYLFEVLPAADGGSIKAMRTLGFDNIEETAHNSSFVLNGAERSSYSNTFTINNAFELTLKATNEKGDTTQIGFKTNVDAVVDNVQSLIFVYNNMVQLGHNYLESQQSGKLLHDMTSVARNYRNELESIGLTLQGNGYISLDKNLLADAVTADDANECFSVLNDFKDSLSSQASEVSIDPMNYVKKVIVAYKNPGHNFAMPYITSIYSGMMLDQYC